MPAYLKPIDGGNDIRLDKPILFVGRHPECDIVINSSRKVSRKHCCIAQINAQYVIRDLGSMNGIRVNENSTRKNVILVEGDEIIIGDIRFRFTGQLQTVAAKPAAITPPEQDLSGEIPIAIEDLAADNEGGYDDNIPADYPIRRAGSDSAVELL